MTHEPAATDVEMSEEKWDSIDPEEMRSVAWLCVEPVSSDIWATFSGVEGPVAFTMDLLAARRPATGLVGAALVCGDMESERAFFEDTPRVSFHRVEGYDLSQASLDRFTPNGIEWAPHKVDCNCLDLPVTAFDLIVASHGAHHVHNLEGFFAQARRSLAPGGLLYIYEWVGPTYLQIPFRNRLVSVALLYALFPRRRTRRTHAGRVKGAFYLQNAGDTFDPSEACNSPALYDEFRRNFNPIAEYRHGGLTYPMFEGLAQNLPENDPSAQRKVRFVVKAEKWLTLRGWIDPLFVVAIGERLSHGEEQMSTEHALPQTSSQGNFISFAQNAEDVVLHRVFQGKPTGFYIDIGANHPVEDSVTKHFYDMGWHGINVEPVRALFDELTAQRPRDLNLCVGVGAEEGTLEFGEVLSNQGLSTFNDALDSNNSRSGHSVVRRSVPVTTLAKICEQHVTEEIDFLKVDVEGFEANVFRGHDWTRFRPKVIVAEDNFSSDWHELVCSNGYTQTLHDGLNRFYVRTDLLDELGPRLNRPAIRAVDGFDPWLYVSQIQQLQAVLTQARTPNNTASLRKTSGLRRWVLWLDRTPLHRAMRSVGRTGWGKSVREKMRV